MFRYLIASLFCLFMISDNSLAQSVADKERIKKHLVALTTTEGFRNYRNLKALNQAADYIKNEMEQLSEEVQVQEYQVDGTNYKNVICSFNTDKKERIIIGAHYDVCGDQDGADDNGSGVAGMLELGRLLKGQSLPYRIDLVAYTLEEPPYFRTQHMGSYIHAKSMHDNNIAVKGMISLEMIGYFSDKKNSQQYPVGFLKAFYGNKGDYITIVQKYWNGSFSREFGSKMRRNATIKTQTFKGPASLPGVDFSDHLNYWHFGYSALMITDTSFYRNHNYHQPTDTIQTLDLPRLAKVVESVFLALKKM